MSAINFNDTENKRADEETKEAAIASIPGGGKDIGGKDNKRADFGVNEQGRGTVKTTGGSKIPGKVASFSGERI